MDGQLESGMFSDFLEKRPVAIMERFLENRTKISYGLVVMDRQQKIECSVIHGRFPDCLQSSSIGRLVDEIAGGYPTP
jgi:hypothetical protein